ncbi:MAG: calcium/sodium antiporter [Proteobacteria bacterium]|nr:calcium/sodium antiporter [Pseudomonadota bacterium]
MTAIHLIGGLIGLIIGGELLVQGASKLARSFGISALVVGLTIVAFGTSSPELIVSLKATWTGNYQIAVANVVGSNSFNVLFILGVCALLLPLKVVSQLVRLDVPIMIAVSGLLILFSMDLKISFMEGSILFAGIVAYTSFLIVKARQEDQGQLSLDTQEIDEKPKYLKNVLLIAFGLGFLVLGGTFFVDGAIALAKSLGVSDTVIGLTIVAAGTSLPEVVTSIMATLKGERDIAIGNVIGSNIYNILAILGISAMASGEGLSVTPALLTVDMTVMLATAIACLPIFISGYQINRWEGFLFLAAYITYTTWLIFDATEHQHLASLEQGLTYFVLPAMALSLSVISYQAIKRRGLNSTGLPADDSKSV